MSDAFPLDLVMLVDDDPDENYINVRALKRGAVAHRVIAFENPLEGLSYLDDAGADPVDVIIVDINMPEISGFEFLARHARMPKDRQARTVIMLLTSSLSPDDLERASVYADTICHKKPLRPEMIIEAIGHTGRPTTDETDPVSERNR